MFVFVQRPAGVLVPSVSKWSLAPCHHHHHAQSLYVREEVAIYCIVMYCIPFYHWTDWTVDSKHRAACLIYNVFILYLLFIMYTFIIIYIYWATEYNLKKQGSQERTASLLGLCLFIGV